MRPNSEIQMFTKKKEFYEPNYPWALELIDLQSDNEWQFNDTGIHNDNMDLKVLPEYKQHALREVLRLFTQYEIEIGGDYWGDVIKNIFPQPELVMLAIRNSYTECVHARAYNEINKTLGLDTEEFYTEYKGIPELNKRMEFIASQLDLPENYNALDVLKSIATFAFMEGAVLYTGFAYIKHFSVNGNNWLTNINAAVNYSIRDEGDIHVTSNELFFKNLLREAELTTQELDELDDHIKVIGGKTYDHEKVIIDRIFSKGEDDDITSAQMQSFIRERVNQVSYLLNESTPFTEELDSTIKDWFYKDIKSIKQTDFFNKHSAGYTKDWDKKKFAWPRGVA